MKARERGRALVRDLESKLRGLVGEAAASGDYEAILHLTALARAVANLAEDGVGTDVLGVPAPDAASRSSATAEAIRKSGTPARPKARSKRKKKRRKRKSGAKAGYPKFLRRGSYLVKIGYSKKEREYSHRAPKRVALLIAEAVARAGAGGRLFTADEMMPVADPKDRSDVPSYQAYMCLGWLRHEKHIEAEGRQGYRIVTAKPLAEAAKESWCALASG